jgi:SPP1 gp7 family putative phage head morphogenesis protein
MADKAPASAFGVKFSEAINYLSAKLPETTMRSDDLAGAVHAKVFTIAGATNISVVSDMHSALKDALANGGTITSFRKDFDRIVAQHGWAYKGKRGWRTSIIFNTNMRSAHMAGRWQQLIANADRRPYLQYRTAGDSRVRPQHRQWAGLIYPITDSFWKTHYPPNGWGCRCTVRAYGQAELDTNNLQIAQPFQAKTRTITGKDGQAKDIVPEGIDQGWDHNVGQSWITPELALGEKLAKLPLELRGKMTDKTITPAFQTVLNTNFKAFKASIKQTRGTVQMVGFLDGATVTALGDDMSSILIESTAIVVVDRKTTHLSGITKSISAPQQVWPDEWMDALPEHLRNYRAVLWDKQMQSLFIIPQGAFNNTIPTIKIRFNRKVEKRFVGQVVSLGSASVANLNDKNKYKLLVGQIK